MRILFTILAVTVLWLSGLAESAAQNKTKTFTKLRSEPKKPSDTLSGVDLFSFPNINKLFYHFDSKQQSKIDRLEKKFEWEKLLPLLEGYVGQFGIQNFYKDTQMLWRLGQLYERLGQYQKAKSLYRLILKHHRGDISKILLYYDSLTELERDYYIPVEYYYELVEYRKNIDTLRPPRSVLINMGTEVNSGHPDYGPSLSSDDELLIFTSQRNLRQSLATKRDEDIYFSRKEYGKKWGETESFTDINTIYNEGSAILTRDGKTIYFTRCESPQSYGNCDIFSASLLESGKWGNIRNLGPNVNSKAWDSQPSLSHAEDTLYFASDRLGGFGLTDIYFTYKTATGEWAPAQNMGPVINTRRSEVSPFYHHEYNILYFSSNGQLVNFGDFDIYKSYKVGGQWQEPKNIGPLVNGKGSEYYFTIDSKAKNLYYARSEEKEIKNLDLFSFPLPMEAQPLATTSFKGTLIDSVSGKPFSGIVSIIDLDNSIEIAPKALRRDGSFDFDLIKDNNYLLIIQGDEFFRIEEVFQLEGDTIVNKKAESIKSRKIRFTSVEFEGGSAEILPEMQPDLDNIFNFLIDNPRFSLKISGHTDSVGDKAKNMKLSQDRADAIKLYLIASGEIEPTRVQAAGFGDTKPIKPVEQTEEDRRTNRRVEFEITAAGNQNQ
jgi:outer membrane protein OmpA-like peptidoglycan-associated protein